MMSHFTQMASTVTRSQSNKALFGCGGIWSIWTNIPEECFQHLIYATKN